MAALRWVVRRACILQEARAWIDCFPCFFVSLSTWDWGPSGACLTFCRLFLLFPHVVRVPTAGHNVGTCRWVWGCRAGRYALPARTYVEPWSLPAYGGESCHLSDSVSAMDRRDGCSQSGTVVCEVAWISAGGSIVSVVAREVPVWADVCLLSVPEVCFPRRPKVFSLVNAPQETCIRLWQTARERCKRRPVTPQGHTHTHTPLPAPLPLSAVCLLTPHTQTEREDR